MSALIQATDDIPHQTHPRCADCRVPMWLVRVSHTPEREEQLSFECKACGQTAILECRSR